MTVEKILKFALLIFALYMTEVTWAIEGKAESKPTEKESAGTLQGLFGDVIIHQRFDSRFNQNQK